MRAAPGAVVRIVVRGGKTLVRGGRGADALNVVVVGIFGEDGNWCRAGIFEATPRRLGHVGGAPHRDKMGHSAKILFKEFQPNDIRSAPATRNTDRYPSTQPEFPRPQTTDLPTLQTTDRD